MNIECIEASTVPDAWFQCVYSILDNGRKYTVEHGSYIGETRLEFDFIVINIKHPYAEPYSMMLPDIPAHFGIPNPVEIGYVEQYIPYLMTAKIENKEDYSYGSRICNAFCGVNQIDYWIDILKKSKNTNQAVLQVAQPSDCLLDDPPCLRHISIKIRDEKLQFFPYFRSWDLWGGMPANLAGLAVVQKYMADAIGIEVGNMVASSNALHIYGYVEELAKLRAGKI